MHFRADIARLGTCSLLGLLLISCGAKEEPYPQEYMTEAQKQELANRTPEEIAEREAYACATVGSGLQVKVPKEYITSRIEYNDINYWGGGGWENRFRWCDNRAASVPIAVKWPDLIPASEKSFNGDEPDTVLYIFQSITNDNNNNKRTPNGMNLIHQDSLKNIGYFLRKSMAPIPEGLKLDITYREDLDLQQATLNTTVDEDDLTRLFKNYYFWHETPTGQVDFIAYCTDFQDYVSRCNGLYDPPDKEMTIDLYFPMTLLGEWKELKNQGWQLLQSFEVQKED
ncbi:hypothetical protein GKC56_05670 [Neisseriaceae bacterium PsAf]|nr:hypothetical protein [Neisseriaceae bacterium PsAf]